MKRSTLALAVLAVALASSAPTQVQAGWLLIRWANGDCKIWHDDNVGAKPLGVGWTQLNKLPYPTWAVAWGALGAARQARWCL
jgi:hypothetical protein